MDAIVVEVAADGSIRLENEDFKKPTLQERRAIIFAAKKEIEEVTELIEVLQEATP